MSLDDDDISDLLDALADWPVLPARRAALVAKVERLRADHVRTILHFTAKGYDHAQKAAAAEIERLHGVLNTCEIHHDVQGIAERTACAVCLTDAVRELERQAAEIERLARFPPTRSE